MKIKVFNNPLKSWSAEVSGELKSYLRLKGHSIVQKGADATVCIGGDGTILYANYRGRLEGSILGIGSRRSYICQLRRDEWKKKILKKLKDRTIDVLTLDVFVAKRKLSAINDVVVHTPDYRVINMEVFVDKKKNEFSGDGIIISSAVGSTSYAYSAGGKKLKPTDRRIEVVPIAPYRRKFSSKILKGGMISIACNRDSALIIDGIYIMKLKKGEKVKVKKGNILKFYRGVGFYGR